MADRAPKALNKLIEYNLVRSSVARYISKPIVIYKPIRTSTSNTILYRGILLYNMIPECFKTMNPKQFTINITEYIKSNIPPDRILSMADFT